MIKVGLFMTDPVKAHERYVAEIQKIRRQEAKKYQGEIAQLKSELKDARRHITEVCERRNKVTSKYDQARRQIGALHKKLEGGES